MKKFLVIIILNIYLTLPSQADNIRDLQIEGMSVGDSLLNFYGEKQILNFQKGYYDRGDFYMAFVNINSGVYRQIGFTLKKNDKKYIIQGIKGTIIFKEQFNECLKWKKDAINDVNIVLPYAKFSKERISKYTKNKDMKNSKAFSNDYFFPLNKGAVRIWCTKIDKSLNYKDRGEIALLNKELLSFQIEK